MGEADLVALSIGEGAVTETGHITLDSEIACLDISPLGAPLVRDQAGSPSQQLAAEIRFARGAAQPGSRAAFLNLLQ